MTALQSADGRAITRRDAESALPSLVAMMVAVPTERAVTTPSAFTVARAVFELVQATSRLVIVLPKVSNTVAVSAVVRPVYAAELSGVIRTEPTGITRILN